MTAEHRRLITRGTNRPGQIEYHFWADQTWDGFDTIVRYLKKHWDAKVIEQVDEIYTRRWVVDVRGVRIAIYHDSQMGNLFVREDGSDDQSVLEQIEADLRARLTT